MASPLNSSLLPWKIASNVETVNVFPKRRGRERKYISDPVTRRYRYAVLSTYRYPSFRIVSKELYDVVIFCSVPCMPQGYHSCALVAKNALFRVSVLVSHPDGGFPIALTLEPGDVR